MSKTIRIILLIAISSFILEAKVYETAITNLILISVYDGDTFKISIPDYPPIVGSNISVRIKGINTPEIKGGTKESKENAIKSRDFLEKILKSGNISLHNISRDKYFRLLSEVRVDNIDVTTLMIKNGYATNYYLK